MMISIEKYKDAINKFTESFNEKHWEDEGYKWEAIKCFQDHWNIDALDFALMLKESLAKTDNLLANANNFPAKMIIDFAEKYPEEVRSMFKTLFDESVDITERYNAFINSAELLNQKYFSGEKKNHYQDLHAISTYLWLQYPDKYYIYKYSEVKAVTEKLDSSYIIKKGQYSENIRNSTQLYQELNQCIKGESELIKKVESFLTDNHYSDPNYITLTTDFGFFISRYYKTNNDVLGDDADMKSVHYWIFSPGANASKWEEFKAKKIMAIGWDDIGNLAEYDSQKEMILSMKNTYGQENNYKNDSYATWQFANEMKPGDVIFAKKGMYKLIGRGIVESDYEFDDSRKEYKNIRRVNWTHIGEWNHPGKAVTKTLTDITKYTDYVEKLNALFMEEEQDFPETPEEIYKAYSKELFLEEVFISERAYDTLYNLIEKKKNVILQGPPGVGKTFAAKRLAYSIMGEKNPNRVTMVQFHQSYAYEDFIMGFRPNETGFELHKGAFYDFCKLAEEDIENDYYFIIDEINRGNLSKIFGELFMLIENDKRGVELQLLYSGEKFSVPKNLYIIGLMNTADRSLAMLDYALRRRFSFFEMKPAFESEGFKNYQKLFNSSIFDNLILSICDLNKDIAEDESLGEGFEIGHSYFCNLKEVTQESLSAIVEFEIIPLLKEYWFDDKDKIRRWSEKLRSVIK